MADMEPGTAAVTDTRQAPRGVLPKGLLTWVMAGVAGVILLITLFAGSPKPVTRGTGTVDGSTTGAERGPRQ